MRKLQTPSFSFNNSQVGSALIGALVMVGIISMVIGVMLSSIRSAIRSSRDRILYEEAYQAAVSGTHVARAWMINPVLGGQMSGNNPMKNDIVALMTAAKKMSSDIIESSYTLASTEPDEVKSTWFSSIGNSTPLADGRYVLYTFPQNAGRIAAFMNDQSEKNFSESLFKGGSADDHTNYVDVVRITTTGTSDETSCSLRETTLIIESRGVAEYAGAKKERIVQQRVLVYPNDSTTPLLSSNEAILTQAGLTIGGSSHINIHWGPVLTKQNLELLGMKLVKPTDPTLPWVLAPADTTFKKFNGAGTYTYNHPDFTSTEVIDKWLSFETGVNGMLMADSGAESLFKDVVLDTGQKVVDFFAQLANGDFSTLNPGLSAADLELAGKYAAAGTSLDQESSYNGLLYEDEDTGALKGALIQGSADVDARIDEFFGTNNYEKLKAYAIDHNGYVRVQGKSFVNSVGKPLYVNPETKQMSDVKQSPSWKPLTDLEQLSMESLVPTNYDSVVDGSLDDRVLFVDSEGQSPFSPIPEAVNLSAKFFWKGIMYVNGDLDSAGAGTAPILTLRTLEEFKDTALDGHPVSSMLLEGILIVNGVITSRGNMSIYGTLAGKGTIDLGGNPSVFYNSANALGRLKDTTGNPAEIRLVAGRMYETAAELF